MKQFRDSFFLFLTFVILSFISCNKEIENEKELLKKEPQELPVVVTSIVGKVNRTSAICGGYIPDTTDFYVTMRGVCWSGAPNPTVENDKTVDSLGAGKYVSKITGLEANKTYYVRAYACNKLGITYGKEFSFTTATVEDVEGNGYHTVVIGNQEWLAENLKSTKYNDGSPIFKFSSPSIWGDQEVPGYGWFGNDSVKYSEIYGALYNWYAVNTGKLAPPGWHVATYNDWIELINYVDKNKGDSETLVKALASKSYWTKSTTPGTIGDEPEKNNSVGFSALGGGLVDVMYRTYEDLNVCGYWWTSTEIDDPNYIYYANYVRLVHRYKAIEYIGFYIWHIKSCGMSVRCVKDK